MLGNDPQDRPTAAEAATALRGGPLPHPPTRMLATAKPATTSSRAPLRSPGATPGREPPQGLLRPQPQRPQRSPGVLGATVREAVRNPYVLGVGLLLLVVLGLLAALLAGGDGSAVKAPAPEKVPVSQLEKDLADLRKAVTP